MKRVKRARTKPGKEAYGKHKPRNAKGRSTVKRITRASSGDFDIKAFRKIASYPLGAMRFIYARIICDSSFHLFLVFLMMALYGTVLSYVCMYNQNRFWYSAHDIGIFDQGIWLLSQGENAFVTVRGFHIFGDHIQFIIAFLAPLFWIRDDIKMLLIAQAAALAFGTIPLYLIAKRRLKNRFVPLFIVLAYILYPALHYLNLENFHPDSFAVPALLFAFYFLTRKNYGLYALATVIALIVKEDIAATVFMMGLYAVVFSSRKVGAATMLAAAIMILSFSNVLYLFNGIGYFHIKYGAFNEFGSTPLEVLKNIVLKHDDFMKVLITDINKKYVYEIFAPTAFLSILSPTTMVLAAPGLFINLITGWPYAHSIQYHYTKAIIPFVFVSVVYGLSNLERLGNWRRDWTRLIFKGVYYLAVVALVASSVWGNMTIGPGSTSLKNYRQIGDIIRNYDKFSPREIVLNNAIGMVPENATVSATYLIVPHMTHRKIIYMFPNPFKEAYWGAMLGNFTPPTPTKDVDYIILDMYTVNPDEKKAIIDKFVAEGRYKQVLYEQEVMLLKREELQ